MRDSTNDPSPRDALRASEEQPGTGETRQIFDELAEHRALAHNGMSAVLPILAAFDVETAAIWANEEFARAIVRHRKTGRKLRDEDVETLVHEFARVLEYEDILKDHPSLRDRIALMTKRLAIKVARSTEESFMNRTLRREREAEEWVQRVRMEILSAFDRRQHGFGLSDSVIADKAERLASDWVAKLRSDYLKKARNEYRRLVRAQAGGADRQDPLEGLWSSPDLVQIFVKSVTGMFPLEQSMTLRRLVDLMVAYDLSFVVPALPDDD